MSRALTSSPGGYDHTLALHELERVLKRAQRAGQEAEALAGGARGLEHLEDADEVRRHATQRALLEAQVDAARGLEADGLEAIGFRKPSTGSAPSAHRDSGASIPQIQRMGSSLIAVAQDGDSESGGIGIWRTGRGWHGTNATGRAGFFAAIQIRVQMNR